MISFNRFSGPVSQAAAGSNSFTVTSSTGNLLALALACDSGVTITGLTDNKGNAWLVVAPRPGTQGCYIGYCLGAATGVTSVSVASTGSGGISVGLYDLLSATGGALDTTNPGPSLIGSNPSQTITAAKAGIVISLLVDTGSIFAVTAPFTPEAMDTTALSVKAASSYYVDPSGGILSSTFTAASGTLTINQISLVEAPAAVSPVFTPGAGAYPPPLSVALSCATPMSQITFTLDGSTPVPGSNGTVYTTPIVIGADTVIKAIASVAGGSNSAVVSATFLIAGALTPNLGIGHIASGQDQPEITANGAFDALDEAANLEVGFAMADADFTLTQQQLGSGAVISMTGTLTAGRHINLPTLINRVFVFENATTGGFSLTVQVTGVPGTTVGVAASAGLVILFSDGTNIEQISGGGGGGGSVPNFADAETPSGTINGVNKTFTLANAPSPAASLILAHAAASSGGGAVLKAGGADFTLSGAGISMVNAPATGDSLLAWYRH